MLSFSGIGVDGAAADKVIIIFALPTLGPPPVSAARRLT